MQKIFYQFRIRIYVMLTLLSMGGVTQAMEQKDADEGFKILHESGITGKGMKVCIIEEGCHANHPVYHSVKEKMEFVSVSRTTRPVEGFEDNSCRRYPPLNKRSVENIDHYEGPYNNHGTYIAGILVGTPQHHESRLFSGGIVPDAHLQVISVSSVYLSGCWGMRGKKIYGTALYRFIDADTNRQLDIEANQDFDFEAEEFYPGNGIGGG